MRLYLLILLMSYCYCLSAQEHSFKKEFSVTSDDDAYLLQRKDKYYTAGTFFDLRIAKEKNNKKIINSFELGQMIYTPRKPVGSPPAELDRPFCGYLYLKFGQTFFSAKDEVLEYDISAGAIGDASLAENIQTSVHKIFGLYHFTGWEYQIGNSAELNTHFQYATSLADNHSSCKLTPILHLNLGTTFTNLQIGNYFCLGQFNNNSNSVLFDAAINSGKNTSAKKHELFFYFYPHITYQIYNATIQGCLFGNSNSKAITSFTEPFVYQQNLGFCYSQGRWNSKIEFVFQTKECSTQEATQHYGSIKLGYRFN